MSIESTVQSFKDRNESELQANAMPFPGAAGDAFVSGPIVIGRFTVRKIVKYDWRVWQQTDNAILKALAAAVSDSEEKVQMDDESSSVAIWCLTHTPYEVRDALKSGVEKFKEKCVEEMEFGAIELPVYTELFNAVVKQVESSCASVVKYAAQGGDESKTVFLADTKASQAMG